MTIRRREIKTTEEQKLLTGLIVSTAFCNRILPLVNPLYFQMPQSKLIHSWVKRYYEKYKEAPKSDIRHIFEVEKSLLKEGEVELVSAFLSSLSEEYVNETGSFNIEYFVDGAIAYLLERSLVLLSDRINSFVAAGKTNEAYKLVSNYTEVKKNLSRWINPMDEAYAEEVYHAKFSGEDERQGSDYLFRFPGVLGQLMGHFERDWLVGFLGPMKRGKTSWLWETAFQAAYHRLKVAFFSLEMSDKGLMARGYKRLVAMSDVSDLFLYPCFDCLSNQTGTCTKRERVNRMALLQDGKKPAFELAGKYRPCTVCRGSKKDGKLFKIATWFEQEQRPRISLEALKRSVGGFKMQWGDRIRICSYPEYSANLSQVRADLDDLEAMEGFVPDVIIIDYADILAPEEGAGEDNQLDVTWKMLKNLAGVRHCLVVTASQSTRDTLDKKSVKASNVARDIRKLAHVDGMFSLNQMSEEKKEGVMRIGVVAHRWMDFNEMDHVQVLQQVNLGQVIIDSY
jgi:hypothetical protein